MFSSKITKINSHLNSLLTCLFRLLQLLEKLFKVSLAIYVIPLPLNNITCLKYRTFFNV